MQHFPNNLIDDIKGDVGKNYFTPVIDYLLSHNKKNPKVLDIGCGNGIFTIKLKKKNPFVELIGLDSSKYAKKRALGLGFDKVYLCKDFNNTKLSFSDQEFDFIICKDVLEHLVKPEFLLTEIHRILKPKGTAIIHIPNHFTLHGRIKFLFTNNIDTQNYFPNSKLWEYPHIRFLTYSSLEDLVVSLRFKVKRNFNSNYPQIFFNRLLPNFFKDKLISKFPDSFAEGFTISIEKK